MDTKIKTINSNKLTLPALPIGYFYRISRRPFHIDQIEIRKKIWFFSKQIDSLILSYYKTEDGKRVGVLNPYDNINNAASMLYYAFKTNQMKHRAPQQVVRVKRILRSVSLEELEAKYDAIYNELLGDYHF